MYHQEISDNDFFKIPFLNRIASKCRFYQHVYAQLLRAQIPKVQKRQSSHQGLYSLLGSGCARVACKMLVKLTPNENRSVPFWPSELLLFDRCRQRDRHN